MGGLFRILLSVAAIVFLLALSAWASENPNEGIGFWERNYQELKPVQDPFAKKDHIIFKHLLSAVRERPGVAPRLFIVKSDSLHISLAFAFHDGGIIISKRVLDICYKDSEIGSDPLAFILAQEIVHQLNDDFWSDYLKLAPNIYRINGGTKAPFLGKGATLIGSWMPLEEEAGGELP